MSTKSKSNPLTLIIIAVVVIFIAAILYKNSQVDNSEKVTIPQISKVKASEAKQKKEYDFTDTADVPSSSGSDNVEDIYTGLSKEERDKKISANLNKYTLYRTPEEVMEVIYKYKELGNDEKAEEYIDFLIKRFPDYEMNL